MSPDGKLTNRTALVTGASRGIGRAIAVALAEAGADIAVHCREQHDSAAVVMNEVRDLGRRAVVVQGDVSRSADIDAPPIRIREAPVGRHWKTSRRMAKA